MRSQSTRRHFGKIALSLAALPFLPWGSRDEASKSASSVSGKAFGDGFFLVNGWIVHADQFGERS